MNGERGRLTLGFNKIGIYSGTNAVAPFDGEGAIDEFGDLIIFSKQTDNSFKQLNPINDIRLELASLKAAGIFDNAKAFVENRKIYRLYFDSLRSTVRIDPELTFNSLYRYYAIRQVELTTSGAYTYITGVVDSVSGSVSNLVDCNIVDNPSGDGTKVSVPQVGGLISSMTDGSNYVVEFYDTNRTLINNIVFQAIAVRSTDLDLSPDVAVTDMYITTNRPISGVSNACFLYQGESVNDLEIRVYLKYADGRSRDITSEQTEGGRLVISGLDEISTAVVNAVTDTNIQSFTTTYTLIRSNASLPDTTTNTTNGATINPASLTISLTTKVYINADVSAIVDKILVAGYVTTNAGKKTINLKYYGHYDAGFIYEITNMITYVGTSPVLTEAGIGVIQTLVVQVPYGNASNYKQFSFTILVPTGSDYCIINSQNAYFIYADASSNGSGHYSGRFTQFKTYSETNQVFQDVTLASLLTANTYTPVSGSTITPNYIRVRDASNSQYLYTTYISDANLIYYTVTPGEELYTDKPLVVEFLYVVLDGNGVATSVFVTGAITVYTKIVV
jgi:hypothetical protein